MSDFIERQFDLRDGGHVVLRLRKPEQRGEDYCCEYAIDWPDRRRQFHAFGVDPIQALLFAMNSAHADLLTSPEWKAGALCWLGGEDLGLPLARSLRPEDFK